LLAVSVRGNGGIFGIAAWSWLTRVASVPRVCAACTVTGNSACIARMSVVGSVTFHCVSCALAVVCSNPSEPVVASASRNCAAPLING